MTAPGRAPSPGAALPVDRVVRVLLAAAALWCLALVVAACTVPVSGGTVVTTTAGGQTSSRSLPAETLVDTDGLVVLLPVGAPTVLVLLASAALERRRRRGRRSPGPVAVTATALLGAGVLLGAFTIGPFLVPPAVLVGLACAHAGSR
ncbi:MAG: hypothetical protein M0029_14265 [Actinomycetota bacterium]|nr:hypothetical protein [Actinomycetota bacterium]